MYDFFFFFFQAEDGIRDLVRSRGLGDVYKRQSQSYDKRASSSLGMVNLHDRSELVNGLLHIDSAPVSYTHLTLPTSDLV